MTTHTEYLPISEEQDTEMAPGPHTRMSWWGAREAQVVDFAVENAGLLLVVCSQFFFALMKLCVKLLEKLDPPTPTLELIAVRMAITVCGCMAFMTANDIPDPFLGPTGVRGLLAAGGLAVFFGLFGMFYALNYLSVADTTVITFLKPFTVALAGHFILGEAYTSKEAIAAVCSLAGVVLIARPSFPFGNTADLDDDAYATSFERLRAVGSSLIGVCGVTASFIIMRLVRSRTHPMHVVTFYSFWCAVMSSITIAIVRERMVSPMTWQWIVLILAITLFGVAAQILVTVGLRYETATRGALVSYTQLLFAVVLELVVFGTVPSLLSVLGAAIIVASQTYAVFSKQKPLGKLSIGLRPSCGFEANLLRSDGTGTSRRDGESSESLDEADIQDAYY